MIGKKLKIPSTINSRGTGLIFPYFVSDGPDCIGGAAWPCKLKARLPKNFISHVPEHKLTVYDTWYL